MATDWTLATRSQWYFIELNLYEEGLGNFHPEVGVEWWTVDQYDSSNAYVHRPYYSDDAVRPKTNSAYIRATRDFTLSSQTVYELGDIAEDNGYVYFIGDDEGGGVYRYYTVSQIDLGYDTWANAVSLSIAYDSTSPDVPTIDSITAESESLLVEWTEDVGTVSYECWYSETNDSSTATQQGGTISDDEYTIVGLDVGVTYYVWLKGVNANATSAFSASSYGTPIYTAPDFALDLYTNAFSNYGSDTDLRKYPINASWSGSTPNRNSTTNDYPIGNLETLTSDGFVDDTDSYAGADRSNWTDGTGQTYPTSVRRGSSEMVCYLPYNATNSAFLAQDLVASTDKPSYGRDVILFKNTGRWYWAGIINLLQLDDQPILYEIRGQVVDAVNWPFEYVYDSRGNIKEIEYIIPEIDTIDTNVDLDS